MSKGDNEALKRKFGLTDEHLNRYDGKDFEERFYLMLLFLDNIECIVPFDERIGKILNLPYPDVSIILKGGEMMLIELKPTYTLISSLTFSRYA